MNWVQLNHGLGRATSTAKDIMDYKLRRDTLDEQKRQFDQNYQLDQRKSDLDEDRVRLAEQMYSDKQTEERRKRNLEQWQNLSLKANEQALVAVEAGEITRPEEFWKTEKAAPLVEAAAQLHLGDNIKNLRMKRRADGGYDAYDGDKKLQSLPVGFTQKRIAAYNIKNGLPDLLSSIGVEARVTPQGQIAVRDAKTGGEASQEQIAQVQQLSQELTEKTGIPLVDAMQADEKADAEKLMGVQKEAEAPAPASGGSTLGMVQGGLARDAANTYQLMRNPEKIPEPKPEADTQPRRMNVSHPRLGGKPLSFDEAKKLAYDAKEGIKEFAGEVGDTAKYLLNKRKTAFNEAMSQEEDTARGVGRGIRAIAEQSADEMVDTLKKAASPFVEGFDTAKRVAEGFFGGSPEKLAEQPQEAIDKVKTITTSEGKKVNVPKSDKMVATMLTKGGASNEVKAALFATRAMQAGG